MKNVRLPNGQTGNPALGVLLVLGYLALFFIFRK